jgi:hypothetical protein
MRDSESAMTRLRCTTVLSVVPSLIVLTGYEASSLTRMASKVVRGGAGPRFVAEVPGLPGVVAIGETARQAQMRAAVVALRAIVFERAVTRQRCGVIELAQEPLAALIAQRRLRDRWLSSLRGGQSQSRNS